MIAPQIFKSYDVRGIVPRELDAAGAALIARAFADMLSARTLVLARDVRASGPMLAEAARNALLAAGVNVLDIGVVSTDTFYFAVAHLDADGGFTISASHNPREWNGFNFCRRGAQPVSLASGLAEVRDRALALEGQTVSPGIFRSGTYSEVDVRADYADYVLGFVDKALIPPLKIVAHGNCGLQVEMLRRIQQAGALPLAIHAIYDRPDGNFPVPGGIPNPLLPSNRGELVETVLREKADLGVAWDADGDRCFFVDETGYFISGYFATAILAQSVLLHTPGAAVVIDPRNIWATQETIARLGGRTVISRAGMTIIPDAMRASNAEFAGEMSAHFYFRRNNYRDNGMIPLLLLLELLGRLRCRLSDLVRPLREHYFPSGEHNFTVADPRAVIQAAARAFAAASASGESAVGQSMAGASSAGQSALVESSGAESVLTESSAGKSVLVESSVGQPALVAAAAGPPDGDSSAGQVDWTDGLSVEFPDWRFNLRPSNTEPLLRLNAEARSAAALAAGMARLEHFLATAGARPAAE